MQPYYAFKELEILLNMETQAMIHAKEMKVETMIRVEDLRDFMDSLNDEGKCDSKPEKAETRTATQTKELSLKQFGPETPSPFPTEAVQHLQEVVQNAVPLPKSVQIVPPAPVIPQPVQPPAVNVVQNQAPSTPAPVAHTGALDVKGFPWDARIHSSSHAKKDDGSWRTRRNLPDGLVAQVEAELRSLPRVAPTNVAANPAASVPPVQQVSGPVIPFAPPPVAPSPVHVELPAFMQQPAPMPVTPQPVPMPVVQPTPIAPAAAYENVAVPEGTRPAHSLTTFKNNIAMVFAQLINEGKITKDTVQSIKDYFKVKEVWNIAGSQVQSIELFNQFVTAGFITAVAE